MYSTLIVKLKPTKRVLNRIAEITGDRNDKRIPIVVTNRIYKESEITEIKNYFYNENLLDEISFDDRSKFLKDILKLPRGLDLKDVKSFWNDKPEFKKLTKADYVTAGLEMENFIIKGSKSYILLNKIPQTENRVYAFQLNDDIKNDERFLNHNPDWDKSKPAFYVGQTSRSRNERYDQHIGGGKLSNRFMFDYAIRPFEMADKTHELAKLFDVKIDDLRHYQSQYYEFKLTRLLKENGYGAYCN